MIEWPRFVSLLCLNKFSLEKLIFQCFPMKNQRLMKMHRNFFTRWESLRFLTKLIQCRDLSWQLCSSKELFNFAKISFVLYINIEQNLFHLNDFQLRNTSIKSICRAKRSMSTLRHIRTVLQMDSEQWISLKWESKVFVLSRSVNRDKRNPSTSNSFTPLGHTSI